MVLKQIKANFSLYLLTGFYFFALFNPFFKKYDYGAGFPLILLLAVVLCLIAVFKYKEKSETSLYEKSFLWIFLGSVVVSFFTSQTQNLGLSEVMAFLSVGCVYLLFAHRKIPWIEKFLRVVVFSTFIAVLLGYVFYFYRPENRMFGPFFNLNYHSHVWPNAFAMFLLLTWPVFLILAEKKGNWKLATLIGIVLSALLFTFSRGALIAFCGQVLLLYVYYFKRLTRNQVLCALLSGLIAVGLFAIMNDLRAVKYDVINVEERAAFSNSEGLTSKQERLDFWVGALELSMEKPFFGWGPFSFRQAYNAKQEVFLANADHPHNLFLKIGAENGVIAVSAFIAFLLALFATVRKRFKTITKKKRDLVAILGVSVLGVFAHSLIDYNLNFAANIFLLFMFLAFIRSLCVKKVKKEKDRFFTVFLSIIIAIVAIYEGGVLAFDQFTYDKSQLDMSLFPRNHYLNAAEFQIYHDIHDGALKTLDKQIELNSLDSQAYYLKGVVYCEVGQLSNCEDSFEDALELNPLNEWEYYVSYARVLQLQSKADELSDFAKGIVPLLEQYFQFVDNNVHFTAYTQNVESAAELVQIIAPHLTYDQAILLQMKRVQMLEAADRLRSEKQF